MKFNEKIFHARKNKGWKQGELADLIGVASNMIGKYERGEASPPLETAKRLSEVLECSLDYLVGLTDTNPEKPAGGISGEFKPIMSKLKQLSTADRAIIISVIDAFIAQANQK